MSHSMVMVLLVFGTLNSEPGLLQSAGARSILPMTYKRRRWYCRESKAQIIDGIKMFMKQELPPLEPGAMSYMMSKEQYLSDEGTITGWLT